MIGLAHAIDLWNVWPKLYSIADKYNLDLNFFKKYSINMLFYWNIVVIFAN